MDGLVWREDKGFVPYCLESDASANKVKVGSLVEEHDFQLEAEEQLREGKSVLIVAPTGLGKTRAALKPFVDGPDCNPLLTTRLIYALPLRALAKGVIDELRELSSVTRPTVHHGDEPESEIFSERAVITTVDQYFTAFAGAPLSWASHKGHAAAGAVFTSYSVFDKVHLLSPREPVSNFSSPYCGSVKGGDYFPA